jgi:imidazolonepropionase-like amidohydrolase
MTALILENSTLVDANAREARPGTSVLIEGERIREVSDRPIRMEGARRIDLQGKTLMPGLIDAHCHVILSDLNIQGVDAVPPTLVTAMAGKLMGEMLDRGFTTIRDAAGADWGIQAAQQRGLIRGPRVWIAGRALSQTGGHGDFRRRTQAHPEPCGCSSGAALTSRLADGVSAVRHAAREELRQGANQIKAMVSGGVASPYDPIANIQYSEEELRAIVEEAAHWNTYVMAHAYTAEAITHALRCGVRTIEHANLIDLETARLAASLGAYIVPTLITYFAMGERGAELGLPEASVLKLQNVLEFGLKSLEVCKEAGAKVGFGTDLLGPLHSEQRREFQVRSEVLSAFEVLESATKTNAEILGMSGELGEVIPEALADLLVLEGNPLENIHLLSEAPWQMIIQNGVILREQLN